MELHLPQSADTNSRQDILGYYAVLISDRTDLSDLWLPKNPDGFYHFPDAESARFLSIEGRDGQWIARCNTIGYFKNVPPQFYGALPLEDGQRVEIEESEHCFELYTEAVTKERLIFTNYILHSEITVSVGSDPFCDIHCSNPLISGQHALIIRASEKWSIKACTQEAIFVNGVPVMSAELTMGDLIYLKGLRILIGSNFLSINDGDGRAAINPRILRQLPGRFGAFTHYSGQPAADTEDEFFNRAPRKHIVHNDNIITVEAPPMSMVRAQMPLMLRMGSSMVMSGKAALSGNYATLLSSLLFPFLSSKYTEKQRAEYESRRETKYTEYLEMKRREILAACVEAENRQNTMYPDLNTLLTAARHYGQFWERRPIDDDFLYLRLGTGEQELRSAIDYPVRHFELEPDHLEEKMYRLVEQKYPLRNVPIVLPLAQDYICGILGAREQILDLVRQLVLQIAVLHSYDEVKLLFLINPEELTQWDFIRYLPHTWDDQRSLRFIATNEVEAFRLGEYIKNLLPEDLDDERDVAQVLKHRPYHIVIALDRKLFNSIEVLKNVLKADNNHGVSIIAAYDNLPKECHRIIRLAPAGKHRISSLRPNGGPDEFFSPDYCDSEKVGEVAKTLANLTLKTVSHAQELPKMITFLEMFRADKVEHLNPLKRWRENNPVKSLAAPVGVAPDGSLFMLDLHEKHQGPHGLVAGMTGSGKSEFIITYILSMAVNYHPDEVAFILIDYKGGGLAGAFDNPATGLKLPHLVGTITNLDGGAIHRSLKSIESELMRRQRILNETKNAVNEGTMDIYSYQKLYRAGRVSEPLPHLFIISDEFAELKSQQPEFMEKLISAARIGRSLGVHLILATQKPAGVVNDQIRSNTKFRVCLRVQDKADSMDMLKRPEAAELTDTGRFYLQVGYNEFFALGQSAWCGASYEPQNTVQVQKDESIEVLDTNGQVIASAKPKVKTEKSGLKQIVAIVKHLSELAKLENYTPKSLWKEPLPKKLLLDELQAMDVSAAEHPFHIPLGLADDPERQDQYVYVQNLSSGRNMLIAGESGSGKSTLLQTLLYSMAYRFSPGQVNFYIFDFSNKLLSSFRTLPHCGAYMTEENEQDFERFFNFITDEIGRRKKLFEEAGAHSYDQYVQDHALPLMFVVIDNIAGFSASKIGSNLMFKFHEYLRSGLGYGVQYIITASFINQINAKARQEIVDRITFRAKDRFAYSEILGKKTKHEPQDLPGRGMCVIDERPLEFHAAAIELEGTALELNAHMNQRLEQIAKKHSGSSPALRMLTLEENQTYEDFCRFFKPGRIPLGYDVKDIRPIALPLKQLNCLSLYFGNPSGIAPVVRNILYACQREGMKILVVKKAADSLIGRSVVCPPGTELLSCTEADSHLLLERMMAETKARVPYRNEFCQNRGIDRTSADAPMMACDYVRSKTTGLMIVFESFADFCAHADSDCQKTFFKFFQLGKGLNYYFTGCFYPDDTKKIQGNPILKGFNPDKHVLLFGGQFNRQDLATLPYEYKNVTGEAKQYNNFLMSYQNKVHPMQMPCGRLDSGADDEDAAPIF